MAVASRLREFLERSGVSYAVVAHPPAYTAQYTADRLGLPPRAVAKAVVIRHAGTLSLAVLPAVAKPDLDRLSAALRDPVELADQEEIAATFTDCEPNAIPPFGNLYGLKTYVDETLTRERETAFPAGSHTEAVRMAFEDYRRLAAPVVLWFAQEPAVQE
jgi:Ala-tRNA(Pro) deacylase